MKTIACIIARTNSRRLPKKVLKKIRNQQMIELLIERIKKTKNLDEIYLCTSVDSEDKILVDIANKNKIKSYQGSRESVIDRMLDVANIEKADNVVRITGDNLFTDFFYLDEMINEHNKNEFDYTRTEFLSIGVTAEVMRVTALKDCYNNIDPYKSEYLFLYMFNPEKYKCGVLIPPKNQQNEFSSLTIDTPEDWERTMYIYKNINKSIISYSDILKLDEKTEI
ncbi:MAG TPA: hypothetical protein ENH75_03890, partial [archaeon]|nr:hypothetical protein [archaeon]